MNTQPVYRERKDPGVAVLLSFLWTGAGQVYAGSTTTGIILIVITWFFVLLIMATLGLGLLLSFPYWVWGMFNASKHAKRYNRMHGLS